MKLLLGFAVVGGALAGAGAYHFWAPAQPAPAARAVIAQAAPVVVPHTPPVAAAAPKSARTLTQPVQLLGVVMEPEAGASRAMLATAGESGRMYRVGDAVVQDWRLASVSHSHVILAADTTRVRVELSTGSAAAAATSPSAAAPTKPSTQASAGAVVVPPLSELPGFIPAPKGAPAMAPPDLSTETNRKFQQDALARMQGARP